LVKATSEAKIFRRQPHNRKSETGSQQMATAPLTTADVRVIPLASADLAGLDLLFDEQCEAWLELLGWDYSGPSRLIRQVVRERDLSGFVAVSGNATIGFAFYVIESNRCSIGDIYISKYWRGLGADKLLAEALLEKIDSLPRLKRVENQSVSIGTYEAYASFESYGFKRFDRDYLMLERSVLPSEAARPPIHTSPNISLRRWDDEDFGEAAKVIHSSYVGKLDSLINNQYCTEEGCADLLAILTEHIWCGNFLPHVSRIAVDQTGGKITGLLIASRISPGIGHMSQISVKPSHQGQGLGRRMIHSSLAEFFTLGFKKVSLAVTHANSNALHLYESCGFRTVHSFPVFHLEK
jgi:ribosomal protein S18 acetylase RimI-like enzyme